MAKLTANSAAEATAKRTAEQKNDQRGCGHNDDNKNGINWWHFIDYYLVNQSGRGEE